MKKRIWILLIMLIGGSAFGQTIVLKSGQRIETRGLRREGDTVMAGIVVADRRGEIGYAVNTIARIEFPEPKTMRAAADSLGQGQAEKALGEVEPVVKYYEPFKDIPGSWWAQAALIRVSALAALQKDAEAEALATDIEKSATDPETARAAALRLVTTLTRKEDFEKAAQICDTAIKQSADAQVLADAWVNKGNLLMAQKQWDNALMAYLHVPVFYSNEKRFMPPALLGSARAYRRLDDNDRAKRSLQELTTAFPQSLEAKEAKQELQKLQSS